ncbi:hypothetical protein F7734_56725 [Scytonema sp. UIC 10036]|uniref:DUF6887 family protein n=1 Tax=Scytonema sp. UIC 10036 TaxID=2304196 RepID=UPI0012DA986D|nr:hypothetical protein [Scytonema sp. UIC 10036]MUH01221.1 hypothetical protein [Scytonema sp. UIC 10036]
MTASNFENMTREELRDYVRHNPHDTAAFHKYVDMLRASPTRIKISPEQIDTELPKLLGAN